MLNYERMAIEIESPEQMGYSNVKYNLTESSFRDVRFQDLKLDLSQLILCYGDHLGHLELRRWIANDYGVKPENILLTPGAAPALFIVATSLLSQSDRILVVFPNYGTNLETPRAMGVGIDRHEVSFENQWAIDVEALLKQIKPNTKLVSITHPHNPTGTVIPYGTLTRLIRECEERKIYLLVDETYRDMDFGNKLPAAVSQSECVITVSSLSKTYGLPGIRMGWLATRNQKLFETFLAAKEQILITGSMLDEEVAFQYVRRQQELLPQIRSQILKHQAIVRDWLKGESRLECVDPKAGVVCFPRFKTLPEQKWDAFYTILNRDYGVYVGPGHWFMMEKRYFRLGFGWPTTDELEQGLAGISKTLDQLS